MSNNSKQGKTFLDEIPATDIVSSKGLAWVFPMYEATTHIGGFTVKPPLPAGSVLLDWRRGDVRPLGNVGNVRRSAVGIRGRHVKGMPGSGSLELQNGGTRFPSTMLDATFMAVVARLPDGALRLYVYQTVLSSHSLTYKQLASTDAVSLAGLKTMLDGIPLSALDADPLFEPRGVRKSAQASVATAGDVAAYVTKLSKLGAEALNTRIANIKRKVKLVERMVSTGKFAKAGKPGPKNARQAAAALRWLANALKWHTDALDQATMATAAVDPVGSLVAWARGNGLEVRASAQALAGYEP